MYPASLYLSYVISHCKIDRGVGYQIYRTRAVGPSAIYFHYHPRRSRGWYECIYNENARTILMLRYPEVDKNHPSWGYPKILDILNEDDYYPTRDILASILFEYSSCILHWYDISEINRTVWYWISTTNRPYIIPLCMIRYRISSGMILVHEKYWV